MTDTMEKWEKFEAWFDNNFVMGDDTPLNYPDANRIKKHIRSLLAETRKEMANNILKNEELNEYLRNPLHMSVRNELKKILSSLSSEQEEK